MIIKTGFKNQWGAILEQQAEVQRLADEHEKMNRLAKNYKYKSQLEAQLAEKTQTARLEEQMKNNPLEQKTLEENYMKYEQKEYDRINNGRQRTKNVMEENKQHLMIKHIEKNTLDRQDKDVFNRQALEDKLHAERNEEEKRKFKDWQREALKHDYDEKMRLKETMSKMEKEKERDYADQYKTMVETFENNNHRTLDTLRKKNNQIMDTQRSTVIHDLNETRKRHAMDNMKKQFESTEKETIRKELENLHSKHHDEKETSEILKVQMDLRRRRQENDVNLDKNYKSYVDNTVNLLSERDRKIKEDREKFKLDYAKELEQQIKEHEKKVKTMYNEMDNRELTLNQKNLISYEIGESKKDMFRLPGLARDDLSQKEYFGRYARDTKPNKLAAELGLGLPIADTASYTSRKAQSNNQMTNILGQSQNKYQNIPKTSINDGLNRRIRDVNSPKYNIISNHGVTDREYEGRKGIMKYKSMANLNEGERGTQFNTNHDYEIPKVAPVSLLSPRTRDEPEYEPTKRDENRKRTLYDGGVSKSMAILEPSKTDKPKEPVAPKVEYHQTPKINPKFERLKKAPESLLDINNKLNNRIMGIHRTGNLRTSLDNNVEYGRYKQESEPYKGPIV